MENVSLNGENIILDKNENYILIDGLYLNNIKDYLLKQEFTNFVDLQKNIFPYCDTPFIIFKPQNSVLLLKNIKKVTNGSNYKYMFSTDSGLLLLIAQKIFIEFLKYYDFDILTDSEKELINYEYWINLNSKFSTENIAILASVGIDNGCDFVGSGEYVLEW